MKILIYLHHPAHFHLFKNIIKELRNSHEVIILATKKDILEELLQKYGFEYINVLPRGRKDDKLSIAFGLLKQDLRLLNICIKNKPDLLVGTSTEITHVGKLLNIPSLFVNEDDVDVIPLVGKIAYPFAHKIIAPEVCRVGRFQSKTISYAGYHELAYLHPNNFEPDKQVVDKYFSSDDPYFIIRFAKLGAHHDTGIDGISNTVATEIIKLLSPFGNVYITSERKFEPEFEPYRININPLDIHHVLAFAKIFIGDSQTMAAEAGVLGTPFIRFNDFVGRISYLDELENKYSLGVGIRPKNDNLLFTTLQEFINTPNLEQVYLERRKQMLSDKIDLSRFIIWLINNYPKSIEIHQANPDYQYNFS